MSRKKAFWNKAPRPSQRRAASYSKQMDDEEARERRSWRYKVFMGVFTATAALAAVYPYVAPIFVGDSETSSAPQYAIPIPTRRESCDDTGYRTNSVSLAVDLSDPADEAVLERLYRMLVDEVNALPPATSVVTASIGDKNFREPLIDITRMCNPGTPDARDIYHTSPKDAAHDFAQFQATLTGGLEKLFTPDSKDFSPICEAITSLIRQPEMRGADKKTLFLASDFLQFTDTHSAYRNSKTFQQSWPRSCDADLTNIDATFFVIERDMPSQTDELINYWVDNFKRLGAQSVSVIKI